MLPRRRRSCRRSVPRSRSIGCPRIDALVMLRTPRRAGLHRLAAERVIGQQRIARDPFAIVRAYIHETEPMGDVDAALVHVDLGALAERLAAEHQWHRL